MARKQETAIEETEKVEVRNVGFDKETDGALDIWRAQQKAKGSRYKRGEAVVELTKRGLKSEGII
jgi:hypothetical protein